MRLGQVAAQVGKARPNFRKDSGTTNNRTVQIAIVIDDRGADDSK